MSVSRTDVVVRRFARHDREQLTDLVNAHIQAVVPGGGVSVSTVLNQLEREPAEYVVDPWVAEREAWIALFNGRVVAAALLRRYRKDESVGIAMRGAAEIGWIVCWPEHVDAGRLLIETLVARLDEWSFDTRQLLGGGLPGPFSYGVHDAWPHLAVLAEHGGFRHTGDIELQLVAEVSVLALPGAAPLDGVRYERRLHAFGPAFIALLGDREIAMLEVDVDLTRNGTMASFAGWADVANLWVRESNRRTGIATWLLGQVAEWLRMSGARQLVAYALEGEESAPVECGAYLLGVDDAARPARRILAPPKTAVDATTTVEI